MKKNPSYKTTVVVSVLLHVIVLGFLFVHFSKPQKLADNSPNIIQAVVVSQPKQAVKKVPQPSPQRLKQLKPVVAAEKIEKIEQRTLRQQPIKSANTVEKTAQSQPTEEETILDQPALSQKKKLDQQKQQQLAKKRRAEEAKKLQHELAAEKKATEDTEDEDEAGVESEKELVTKDLENNLKSEQQELNSAKAQVVDGEIDKYRQKIIQAISQKWLMPDVNDQSLVCKLLVHLGPGGVVVSVDIIKESGDSALDRSARTAVIKASPLPVPESSELFDKFRSLRLTFRPQGVVAG